MSVTDKNPPDNVLIDIAENGVATLTLNRIEKHNAFDANIIQTLLDCLTKLSSKELNIRCLIIQANGSHFSAGADLNWMKSIGQQSMDANQQDAEKLALLLHKLDTFPHPTLAIVQGNAYGGALGLICCCDIAIAAPDAQFCLSEVKLGLVPATIAPYVCRTIGQRQARKLMLTAESIKAKIALKLGIIHHISKKTLEDKDEIIQKIVANCPEAMTEAKKLCAQCEQQPINDQLLNYTSDLIAKIRSTPQAQEGIKAFMAKRAPIWTSHNE